MNKMNTDFPLNFLVKQKRKNALLNLKMQPFAFLPRNFALAFLRWLLVIS